MKKFELNNQSKQQDDVICYAFNYDLVDASIKELKDFLSVLCQCFPHTKSDDGHSKPRYENVKVPVWKYAHDTVLLHIQNKTQRRNHWYMFYVSLFSASVLFLTLIFRVSTIETGTFLPLSEGTALLQETQPSKKHPSQPPMNKNSSQEKSPALNNSSKKDSVSAASS